MHTTVIIAADRREARSELGAALGDPQWDVLFFCSSVTFSNKSIGIRRRVLAFSLRTHDVVLSFGWRDAWSLK